MKDGYQDERDGICHIQSYGAVDQPLEVLIGEDLEVGAKDRNLDDR